MRGCICEKAEGLGPCCVRRIGCGDSGSGRDGERGRERDSRSVGVGEGVEGCGGGGVDVRFEGCGGLIESHRCARRFDLEG